MPALLSAIKGIFTGGSIVKDIGDVIDNLNTSKEEKEAAKAAFQQILNSHAEKMAELDLEAYKAETGDRDSARKREVGIAQAGKLDIMMYVAGFVGLGAFAYIVYVITSSVVPVENRELFNHLIGMVEGVALTIFAYYFGSSKGSKDKTKTLADVAKGK